MFKIFDSNRTKFKVVDTIQFDNGVKAPCICGQIGQCEVVSQNGYYYKRDFWPIILSNPIVQDIIARKEMRGTIEHPEDDAEFLCTPYEKTSHLVIKAWEDNGNPYGVFALLNNPKGNAIKALIDLGAPVGVSTRGMGNFGRDQKGQFVEYRDYMLITWDIVDKPNFGDLRMSPVTDSLRGNPTFQELCQMHQLKDSADEHYDKQKLLNDMNFAIQALSRIRDVLLKI